MGPGLGWGSPLQKLPPVAEPAAGEMNQRGQETRSGMESGGGGDKGLRPAPPALPEPARRVAGWLRASAGLGDRDWLVGWRPGSPRSALKPPPSTAITGVSRRRHDLHKPHLTRGRSGVIGSAGAEWQARFQVGTGRPARPGRRSAPRPPARADLPGSREEGGGLGPICTAP